MYCFHFSYFSFLRNLHGLLQKSERYWILNSNIILGLLNGADQSMAYWLNSWWSAALIKNPLFSFSVETTWRCTLPYSVQYHTSNWFLSRLIRAIAIYQEVYKSWMEEIICGKGAIMWILKKRWGRFQCLKQ